MQTSNPNPWSASKAVVNPFLCLRSGYEAIPASGLHGPHAEPPAACNRCSNFAAAWLGANEPPPSTSPLSKPEARVVSRKLSL